MRFVVLLGIVSLFADMTYEGARSITGPYLGALGASATTVGVVAGLGELIGYGLRLVSGYLSDRTGRYWAVTIAGYSLNLVAVPLLALTGRWEFAALLIIAERTGKAMRTPARDAMLSHATQGMGRGWGFGVHEALDQTGAVLGPLAVALVLSQREGYRAGFALLAIPAVAALAILLVARRDYPRPRDLETDAGNLYSEGLPRRFWLYLGASALVAASFADFPLIAYHFREAAVAADVWIPVFYATAMGVDAVAALLFGRLFDRHGFLVLAIATLLAALAAPLVFLGGAALALAGLVLWGIGMGTQESIMRAAVGGMVSPTRRGSAYGIFNAGYGLCWFAGSVLLGVLYDQSIAALVAFSVLIQLAAVPVLLLLRGGQR